MLRGVLLANWSGRASVSAVAELCGVGRSTFYECFDDFEHALVQARAEAVRDLIERFVAKLERSRGASSDRLGRACQAWCEVALEAPLEMLAAVSGAQREVAAERERSVTQVFARAVLDSQARRDECVRDAAASEVSLRARDAAELALAGCAKEAAKSIAEMAMQAMQVSASVEDGLDRPEVGLAHASEAVEVAARAARVLEQTLRRMMS
ncbi:MAG: hypothetical protein ACOY0T_33000 [Myxococcota bacterium]